MTQPQAQHAGDGRSVNRRELPLHIDAYEDEYAYIRCDCGEEWRIGNWDAIGPVIRSCRMSDAIQHALTH